MATDIQGFVDAASEALKKSDFKNAAVNFEKIRAEGFTSPSIEALLARSYVEIGEPAKGVEHFYNALSLNRKDPTLRSDIALAQTKIPENLGLVQENMAEVGFNLSTYIRAEEALSLGSLLLLGAFFLALLKGFNKFKRYILGACFFALLFFSLSGISYYGKSIGYTKVSAKLFTAPTDSASVDRELPAGARFKVIRKSGDFVQIERAKAFKGWIQVAELGHYPF